MRNSDTPAMPLCTGTESGAFNGQTYTKYFIDSEGLTKREMFCLEMGVPETGDPELDSIIAKGAKQKAAMQLAASMLGGIVSNSDILARTTASECADTAVKYADALLKRLDKCD